MHAGPAGPARHEAARISLANEAYIRLEEMIVTLELQPGSVFSEAELSRKIRIGRTPLREALQRLTAEGKLGEAGQKLEELKRALDKLNAHR